MTIYAQIMDGTIIRTTGGFTAPGYGEDSEWHDFSDPDERNAYLTEYGWHIATEVNRPSDTSTHTHELTYELIDGQPTQVWTQREWTAEELNERAKRSNSISTSTKLVTVDFPAMQAILSQTNAELRTDPSQEIKDLARAVRRLTRRVENLTDGSE